MSAVHREWVEQQADAAPNPTTRHYARTLDEAFKTPAWRTPVQGPYRRGSRLRAHLARHALRWALLLLGAALLIEGLA